MYSFSPFRRRCARDAKLFKQTFSLTGASRTDAGVHALQNYLHFDTVQLLQADKNGRKPQDPKEHSHEISIGLAEAVYNLNAILPRDIVIKRIYQVADEAHCRFDAVSREYKYFIYQNKRQDVEKNELWTNRYSYGNSF